MKKFLYFFLALFTMVSCASNEEVLPDMPAESRTSGGELNPNTNLSKFDIYGSIHNHLLKHVADNFPESKDGPDSISERINFLLEFQMQEISNVPISQADQMAVSSYLAKHKNGYFPERSLPYFTGTPVSMEMDDEILGDISDIRSIFKEACAAGLIDMFELERIIKISDYIVENVEGTLSVKEFEEKIDDIIAEWEKQYADTDFSCLVSEKDENGNYLPMPKMSMKDAPKGAVLGVILNITRHSLTYWNGPGAMNPVERIAPWILADAAGAVIGGAGSLLYQLDNENIDWGSVGWSALTNGVAHSTGIVGKVVKWLRVL